MNVSECLDLIVDSIIIYGIEGVPFNVRVTPIRKRSGYGRVPGLPDYEMADAYEMERWMFLNDFGDLMTTLNIQGEGWYEFRKSVLG